MIEGAIGEMSGNNEEEQRTMSTVRARPPEEIQGLPDRRQQALTQGDKALEKGSASKMHRNVLPSDMTEAEAARVTANLVDLLGTVSHELRSPLAAIKGYAATLLRNGQRLPLEEQREFIETIHQASERLEAIVDRLLEMAQLEVAAPELMYHPLNFATLVQASFDQAERAIARSGRRLSLTLDVSQVQGAPTLVNGDERRLRIVVDHLLENAINYTPDGGTITLSLNARRPDTALVVPTQEPITDGMPLYELVVSDTGRGIPTEDLHRIFERFHRVDMRLTREVAGLGLGLAICNRIVDLHGGAIWVDSVVGAGSTFHVLLPGVEPDAHDDLS